MYPIIRSLLLASILASCDANMRVVVSYVPPKLEKHVSSSVEIIRSKTGRVAIKDGNSAANLIVRILDKDCTEIVFDLGEKSEPSYNIPIDAYFQNLCLETTYINRRGFEFKLSYQPIYIEGPKVLNVKVSEDNQFFEFQDVEGASSYTFRLFDSRAHIIQSNDRLFSSYIDFEKNLESGDYTLVVHAVDSNGRNIKAIRVAIEIGRWNEDLDPNETILSLNLSFERQQYQTRSVKRILIPEYLLVGNEQLEVNQQVFNTKVLKSYSGAFAAMMNADDASMSGALSYTKNKASVFILGLSQRAEEVDVKVRDFDVFSVLGVSPYGSEYIKNGFESWVSPYSHNVVESGEYELATSFGVMIVQ